MINSEISKNIKLFTCDLDGTLIIGNENLHIWELIWLYIGAPEKKRTELFQKYTESEILYSQWCNRCISIFKDYNLEKNDFIEIGKTLRLRNGVRQLFHALKDNNIKIVIISGGIDFFLYDIFPDVREYVDEIYINKIYFDKNERINKIKSTDFDFDSKPTIVTKIMEKESLEESNVVFLGGGSNDEEIARLLKTNSITFKNNFHDNKTLYTYKIDGTDLYKEIIPLLK